MSQNKIAELIESRRDVLIAQWAEIVRRDPRIQSNDDLSIPDGGSALAVSKGVDRDRAVDESGNQIAVFGRVGAHPLSLEEQHKLYLRPDGKTVWTVSDEPGDPVYVYREPSRPSPQK